MKYEILTILSPSVSDAEREACIKKYTDVIESNNGKIVTINKWGLKKLAYPINFKREGFYVLLEIDCDSTVPLKINNLMNIDEIVLRSLCLKREA